MFGYKGEQKVQALEAELAAVGRSQAMIEFSLDGTIINANENFLRMMGYTLSEIAGKPHSLFIPAAERESTDNKQLWADLRRGECRAATFRRIAKDGREIWLHASYNPILDSTGKPAKVIKIASDVTRAWMESADNAGQIQALRRSQAVIEFAPNGTILTANDKFLTAMGYTLPEITGQHHKMFVAVADRDSPAYRAF